MCTCKFFSKVILIVTNLLILLAGGLMLAFGIVAKVNPDLIFDIFQVIPDIKKVSPAFDWSEIINGSAVFMIVLGVVVFLLGFLGCFGSCCENVCLLTTYLIVLLVVLCGEVALIIFAAVSPNKLKSLIQDVMKESLAKFDQDISFKGIMILPTSKVSLGWSFLQLEAKCCGVNGYSDYNSVPLSCCKTKQDFDVTKIYNTPSDLFLDYMKCLSKNPDYINSLNCYDSIYELVRKSAAIAIGIAAGIVGAQLILITATICLCRAIKSGDD